MPGAVVKIGPTIGDAGWTSAHGTIHAASSFNVASIEHEYGHVLQSIAMGSYQYAMKIMKESLFSATLGAEYHRHYWTEIQANGLAVAFFGTGSDIALNPSSYPLN